MPKTQNNRLISREKPSEVVRQFLLKAREENVARLPSIRALSAELGVSVSTVQKVFSSFKKNGLLTAARGSGTFIADADDPIGGGIRLAINHPPIDPSDPQLWHGRIYSGMLAEASGLGIECGFIPLPHCSRSNEESDRLLLELMPKVDGVLALYPHLSSTVRTALDLAGKPYIAISPGALNDTRNFVAPDYIAAGRRVAQAFAAGHRRKILFLAQDPPASHPSHQFWIAGLVPHLDLTPGTGMEFRCVPAGSHLREAGKSTLLHLVRDLRWMPDAILAAGDFLAMGCLDAALEIGLQVPGQLAVIGTSGLFTDDPAHTSLTRIGPPLEKMGAQALRAITEMIQARQSVRIGAFMPCTAYGGGTTLSEEFAHLSVSDEG